MIKGARILTFNALGANCIVMWDEARECVVFDPGYADESEKARIEGLISAEGLHPRAVLLTHGHFDHIYGVADFAKRRNLPVYMSAADKVVLMTQSPMVTAYGLPVPDPDFETTDISDGESITVGSMSWTAICTPGHTPGGICWHNARDKVLISGDTLFAGSIGRSDLPGGDYDQLMDSIHERLLCLDPDTDVLPGHGGCTTIIDERLKNPFLEPFNEPLDEEETDENQESEADGK